MVRFVNESLLKIKAPSGIPTKFETDFFFDIGIDVDRHIRK